MLLSGTTGGDLVGTMAVHQHGNGRPVVAVTGARSLYRSAIGLLLSDCGAVEVAGIAGSAEELEALLDSHRLDAVVVDDGGRDGIDQILTRAADHEAKPTIVIVGSHSSEHRRVPIEGVAACTFLPADAGLEPILRALSAVAPTNGSDGYRDAVTAEEIAILRALARGLDSEEIAAEMAMSVATIKRRLCSIKRKLGVRTRSQAVAKALRLGIIEGDAR